MTDRLAFFPKFAVRFQWNIPETGNSLNLITLQGYAPLLFFPASHFFIGFGPEFSMDVASSFGKETGIGLASEIGGHF